MTRPTWRVTRTIGAARPLPVFGYARLAARDPHLLIVADDVPTLAAARDIADRVSTRLIVTLWDADAIVHASIVRETPNDPRVLEREDTTVFYAYQPHKGAAPAYSYVRTIVERVDQ